LNSVSGSVTRTVNGIALRVSAGGALKRHISTIFNSSDHYKDGMAFLFNHSGTTGARQMMKGTDFEAGDTITFDLYYYRHRTQSHWGIGQAHGGITLNIREYFR